MGGFNLGGFGGQLTADELQRVLAAVNGGRMDPAMDAPQQQPPPVMPQEPPPLVQEAPPPPVEEPPEPPPDMSVQRARGGPAKAIEAYQGENLADANKRIEIAGRSGDSTGQDAASYDAQAEIRGRQAQQSKTNIDAARSQVEERRAHEQRYQQEADRLYEEMRAHTQPPPQSTISKVLGIVGAVASMGGNKGATAGLGMLSNMLGSDTERWAAEQQANSGLYQAALASVGSDRQGMQSDLDVAQRMTALEAHEIDASLEQVKAMGLSRNATRTAQDLQLAMRQRVRDGLIGMEAAKAKAAGAGRRSAEEDALWRMPLKSLRQLAPGGGGELASQVLGKREEVETKTQKNTAGGADGVQQGVGGGARIPGLQLTKKPSDVTQRDYEQAKEISDGFSTIRTALDNMAEAQGTPTIQAKRNYDKQFAFAVGALNSLANAGVLNPGELAAWKERMPAHVIDNVTGGKIGAAFVDEEADLGTLRDQFKDLAQQKLRSRGYDLESGTGGGRGAKDGPAPDPRVRSGFSAPSAGSVGIQRDAKGGIALPRTGDPSPQELARAYLSEEGVPEEWLK
jgi:hypothetical protein